MMRGGQAKIADFGLARFQSGFLTRAGTAIGTPLYMSPEQFDGDGVDARTDLWSTGVVLYQLLTGVRPFEGAGFATIMRHVQGTDPPPPSQVCDRVSTALDAVVMCALAKQPDRRFASAEAFADALLQALDAPGSPAGVPVGVGRTGARGAWMATLAAAVLVLAGGAWGLHGSDRADRSPLRPARRRLDRRPRMRRRSRASPPLPCRSLACRSLACRSRAHRSHRRCGRFPRRPNCRHRRNRCRRRPRPGCSA